jgi:hypothetical protein
MKQLFSLFMIAGLLTACNNGAEKAAELQRTKQKTIDSLNAVLAKQKVIDSMKAVTVRNEKNNTHVVETTTMVNTSPEPAKKKKGWSHTAKGALVGAGAGAITGAIINHNDRVKGAAIGTVIGAGVGAGTGLIVDKSVKKKKKKAANQ